MELSNEYNFKKIHSNTVFTRTYADVYDRLFNNNLIKTNSNIHESQIAGNNLQLNNNIINDNIINDNIINDDIINDNIINNNIINDNINQDGGNNENYSEQYSINSYLNYEINIFGLTFSIWIILLIVIISMCVYYLVYNFLIPSNIVIKKNNVESELVTSNDSETSEELTHESESSSKSVETLSHK